MTFLPDYLINDNNHYTINNNIITVYRECDTISCICNDVYTDLDYQVTNDYSCSFTSIQEIDHSHFTSDYYYRKDFPLILIMLFIFCFFIFYCPFKIITRFFRRFDF